jgi:hypothetical protein
MESERGGPMAGFFFAIAAIIICFGLLAVACGACSDTNNSLGRPELVSHHDDRDGNSGYDGGENDQRRCQGDNCRGSFSPGPFDRSPIDIHDNQVCISPDCSSRKDDKKGTA